MGNLHKIIRSKRCIQSLIEEGEQEHQDFKFQISDARKIARSISAFANKDGGRLLVGVKDNGNVAGIESDEEIYMIEQAATMYCRPMQTVDFTIYRVEGKNVLKVDIKPSPSPPVWAQDDDNKWKVYYRVADENIIAHPLHVKIWQRNRTDRETQFVYGDKERQVMEYTRQNNGVTVKEYMKLAHISRHIAEESIISLCLIGALVVKYEGNRFFLDFPSDL